MERHSPLHACSRGRELLCVQAALFGSELIAYLSLLLGRLSAIAACSGLGPELAPLLLLLLCGGPARMPEGAQECGMDPC